MTHEVVLYFDAQIESRLLQLDEKLIDLGLEPFGSSARARPHITLASYDQSLSVTALDRLDKCARDLPPLDVRLLSLGWFPTKEGVVYLAPAVTLEMLIMHAAFHRLMGNEGITSLAYFRPRVWVPHCTLVSGARLEMLPALTEACQLLGVFLPGKLTALGVIEMPVVQEVLSVVLAG